MSANVYPAGWGCIVDVYSTATAYSISNASALLVEVRGAVTLALDALARRGRVGNDIDRRRIRIRSPVPVPGPGPADSQGQRAGGEGQHGAARRDAVRVGLASKQHVQRVGDHIDAFGQRSRSRLTGGGQRGGGSRQQPGRGDSLAVGERDGHFGGVIFAGLGRGHAAREHVEPAGDGSAARPHLAQLGRAAVGDGQRGGRADVGDAAD